MIIMKEIRLVTLLFKKLKKDKELAFREKDMREIFKKRKELII